MKKHLMKLLNSGQKSIFRALFVPLILVMLLQAAIFYFAAVYGGIQESLSQNAADILNERLLNRKNEIEDSFNSQWSNLDSSIAFMDDLYSLYEKEYGKQPFITDTSMQIQFLKDADDNLIETLRENSVTGIYLILNDEPVDNIIRSSNTENKYGFCVRDMDPTSNYSDREDLLLERAPSGMIDQTRCSLDSWWESQYTFDAKNEGSFFYNPLQAALDNPGADGEDIAYLSEPYQLNENDLSVISYSLPLVSEEGYPYGVLGIELSTKYLSTFISGDTGSASEKSCYVLASQNEDSAECEPIVGNGALYSRCFPSGSTISTKHTADSGGFTLNARGDTQLYGIKTPITVYNNNNPFEDRQLVLISLVESSTMFAYLNHIKRVLFFISLLSLVLGIICILVVSRIFAAPITALAKRVSHMTPEEGFDLGHLGIIEIDQLVDSIEDLNQNVSKNIARTEFFSRMSHDMRTPMNAIISFSSPELLEGADEALKDNYLDKIHNSGQYLLGLINEVLDMTKIESKKTELQYEPIVLQQTWDTIISIIDKLAQKKSITFVKNTFDSEHAYVLADQQHLSQIVMNLLSNAVKFTPEEGTVRLEVHLSDAPNDSNFTQCSILIQDNGIGISSDFMKNLYTPFEQEHEGREGTGLGLSIAKKLVELMNGTIDCESTKGLGTTFRIMIPFEKCSDSEIASLKQIAAISKPVVTQISDIQKSKFAQPSVASANAANSLSGKRILVCEDHPMNTQIICRLLERKGIQVAAADNGKKGLEIFSNSLPHSFDAILMDIRMPVMDGLETTAAIRALDRADADSIPILAMTANAFEEDVRASRKAGMNAHLSKPIEPDKLYRTLEQYLC